VYIKSLLRNHRASCIVSNTLFRIISLSRLEIPVKCKSISAVVISGMAGEAGGFIKNQSQKRDIYTQDTGEKGRA
jgi:hypothetical protein